MIQSFFEKLKLRSDFYRCVHAFAARKRGFLYALTMQWTLHSVTFADLVACASHLHAEQYTANPPLSRSLRTQSQTPANCGKIAPMTSKKK
jgi:hypothetical protein